jgi:hypothetical protein
MKRLADTVLGIAAAIGVLSWTLVLGAVVGLVYLAAKLFRRTERRSTIENDKAFIKTKKP